MLQLIYVSSVTRGKLTTVSPILDSSRRNNVRDGITGLLYSDGGRFLQVLEGPTDKVRATFDRIKADTRHQATVILSSRAIAAREFDDWAMAHRAPGDDGDAFLERIERLTSAASANVRATFQSFADLRRGQGLEPTLRSRMR